MNRNPNTRVQRGWFALTLGVMVGLTMASAAETGAVPIARSFFGMHFFYAAASLRWPGQKDTPIPDAVGSWRLWNAFGSEWANLEPEPGKWDFRLLDRYVELGRARNLELLLTLGETPRWASARPDEPTSAGMGSAAGPRDLADWEDYVHVVATRYRGRIRYYEIWNEPAFSDIERTVDARGRAGFFSGSSKQMVELARSAHRIIKAVDPDAQIVSPSMAGQKQGIKRLDAFLSAGGGQVIDIVGFHFYQVDSTEPERLPALVEEVRQTLAKYGISHKPLWNTESGLVVASDHRKVEPLEPGGIGVLSRVFSAQEAAARLARFLVLGASAGIERYFWFAWDSGSMGLSDRPGPKRVRAPTAVGIAYATIARWMTGAHLKPCRVGHDGVRVCELLDGARAAYIVWRPNGAGRWTPPATGAAQVIEHLDGSSEGHLHGELSVGPEPMLVKGDNDPWQPAR